MGSIVRITEVIASSTVGIEEAVKQGVMRAAKALENVQSVWCRTSRPM